MTITMIGFILFSILAVGLIGHLLLAVGVGDDSPKGAKLAGAGIALIALAISASISAAITSWIIR